MPDLSIYDHIIVMFSGGKDSSADIFHLLDLGADPEIIELWHHKVDGDGPTFMDWPVTEAYCRAFAKAFDLPIYFSWKVDGFKGEMLRENALTKPTIFESPCGSCQVGGTTGKRSTRRMFPQQAASLNSRWCSAYCKIDPASTALRNQERFNNSHTLVVTGERAEESPARAKYETFEPHRTDLRDGKVKRHIDHWRPIHGWKEKRVWSIIKRHGVVVHPAYYLGWGRLSCATCIFGSANQWASYAAIAPDRVEAIAQYEDEFEHTINRKKTVRELVAEGTPYPEIADRALVALSQSTNYTGAIVVDPEDWKLPAGAFGESAGPT